jgi:hypothetical protein
MLAPLLAAGLALALQAVELEARVGLSTRVGDVVLAGSELEVAPLARETPVVLRITRVAPHGDAFRYDFEVVGLEPGTYDLGHFLRRKDASETGELGAPRLAVRATLAEGVLTPNAPPAGPAVRLGGYRTLLWLAGSAWVVGLVAIALAFRRRRAKEREAARPETLADRLEPLVRRALAGELAARERAALELGLIAFWTRRLRWEHLKPEVALERLRAHPDASPLLLGLERWLHAPGERDVDVARLLEPYRTLPPEELGELTLGEREPCLA